MIKNNAQAGSLESCDIQITIKPPEPKQADREINLQSVLLKEYGDSIKEDIHSVLDQYQIKGIIVEANDRGALSPTIKARTEAALLNAMGSVR